MSLSGLYTSREDLNAGNYRHSLGTVTYSVAPGFFSGSSPTPYIVEFFVTKDDKFGVAAVQEKYDEMKSSNLGSGAQVEFGVGGVEEICAFLSEKIGKPSTPEDVEKLLAKANEANEAGSKFARSRQAKKQIDRSNQINNERIAARRAAEDKEALRRDHAVTVASTEDGLVEFSWCEKSGKVVSPAYMDKYDVAPDTLVKVVVPAAAVSNVREFQDSRQGGVGTQIDYTRFGGDERIGVFRTDADGQPFANRTRIVPSQDAKASVAIPMEQAPVDDIVSVVNNRLARTADTVGAAGPSRPMQSMPSPPVFRK